MKTLKKFLKWTGIAVLLIGIIVGVLYMVYLRPIMSKMQETSTIQMDSQLTLVIGGGGNSAIFNSSDKVVVIDTKMDAAAKNFHDKVIQMAGNKPITIINTHLHPDHTGGNELYKGATIIAGGNYTQDEWEKDAAKNSMPTVWLKDKQDIYLDNDTLSIFNLPYTAHTISDVMVYDHHRKILFVGDIILNKQAPVLMGKADVNGYMQAFEYVTGHFDIETIVPGHGKMSDKTLVNTFRQYFIDMKMASKYPADKKMLVAKYSDWMQIPIFMSPGATIEYFEKHP